MAKTAEWFACTISNDQIDRDHLERLLDNALDDVADLTRREFAVIDAPDELPTIGTAVLPNTNTVALFVNMEWFFRGIDTDTERLGVLVHECRHLWMLKEHVRIEDDERWNAAADYAINSVLEKEETIH